MGGEERRAERRGEEKRAEARSRRGTDSGRDLPKRVRAQPFTAGGGSDNIFHSFRDPLLPLPLPTLTKFIILPLLRGVTLFLSWYRLTKSWAIDPRKAHARGFFLVSQRFRYLVRRTKSCHFTKT